MTQSNIDIQAQKLNVNILSNFEPVRSHLDTMDVFGYALLVNYSVLGYEHFHSTYPVEWQNEYDSRHYHVLDPVMIWALFREGVCRWSETGIPDTRGVHKKAARHGIRFGGTWSRKTGSKKSVLFVARSDREFEDEELARVEDEVAPFFDTVRPQNLLSDRELDALRLLADGATIVEIAETLNVGQSAVKERISSARKKLNCKNTAQLILRAAESGLL